MILQSLVAYYEAKRARGEIDVPGWAQVKIGWALDLDDDGQIVDLIPLTSNVQTISKKKTKTGEAEVKTKVINFQVKSCPAPAKKSIKIVSNFLYGTTKYMFGISAESANTQRDKLCFEAAKQLHQDILGNSNSAAAKAICLYFDRWNPDDAMNHPVLAARWEDVSKAVGSVMFWYHGCPVTDDPEICRLWDDWYNDVADDAMKCLCSVTGREDELVLIHPNISGVSGANSTGASLCSYNTDSACSWGWVQCENAHIGKYAATAYTLALNQLLADKDRRFVIGDTTIVCWAENADPLYPDFSMNALYGDSYTENDFLAAMRRLAHGQPVEWNGRKVDPNMKFYMLGLAPNAARLSVRFFYANSFGAFVRNVQAHQDRLALAPENKFDRYQDGVPMSLKVLLGATINQKAKNPTVDPRLSGDMLLAVLNNTQYPATLINGVMMRIRADRKISHDRMAAVKAYYLKNSQDKGIKEVMTVSLNRDNNHPAYVCGQLLAVLERVQKDGINKETIHDRYFSSASSTPANVFPTLVRMAQPHLAKLISKNKYWGETLREEITNLYDKLGTEMPRVFTMAEQGIFQMGYYHRMAEFNTPRQTAARQSAGNQSDVNAAEQRSENE